jgi:hypothetical protein
MQWQDHASRQQQFEHLEVVHVVLGFEVVAAEVGHQLPPAATPRFIINKQSTDIQSTDAHGWANLDQIAAILHWADQVDER